MSARARRYRVGVFDSGLGGLTVLAALERALPTGVDFLYLGDTARVPYGGKSPVNIQRYTRQAAEFFVSQRCDAMVIACNSASATALDHVQQRYPALQPLGVITPASEQAAAAVRDHASARIGVISTRSTEKSGAYVRELRARLPQADIVTRACPLFVPLVEEGWAQSPITQAVIREYLHGFIEQPVDVMILGCTHYPILREAIRAYLPAHTQLLDSADPTALAVRDRLPAGRNAEPSTTEIYATDVQDSFRSEAGRFLGRPVERVHPVDLEGLSE